MLVTDLISSVRARLRQRGTSSAFTNDAIIDYINEILLEISDTLEFTRVSTIQTPDSNKRIYLPADCLRLVYVGRNGLEIVPMTPNEAAISNSDLSLTRAGGIGYIFTNGYLQLGSTEPVVMHYIQKIPAIDNENQDINVRDEYRMPIVKGVTALCFVELGQNDKAAFWQQQYEKELDARRHTIRQSAWKMRSVPSMPPVES